MLVFYELTQACDLVCQHCRACAQAAPRPEELSTEQSKRLIDQLTEFPKPPMLVLTGGDPLKRADVFSLVEYATDAGLEVSITPSATPLVTRDVITRLRDSGIVRLAVSIDGANAETHDAFRGVAGSFAHSLQILQWTRDAGISTQVNTTVSPVNVEQLDHLADLLAGFGISLWSVFLLVPVGRAALSPRLTPDEYEQLFERLWHHSQCQPYLIKTTEAPHYRRFALRRATESPENAANKRAARFVSVGVNDGRGVMFVGHTGTILPSGFLPVPCGRFPQDHVVDIYQNSPTFHALRDADRLEGKCGVCEFRQICGGSRARTFAVTGSLFAAEPDCSYEPKVGRALSSVAAETGRTARPTTDDE